MFISYDDNDYTTELNKFNVFNQRNKAKYLVKTLDRIFLVIGYHTNIFLHVMFFIRQICREQCIFSCYIFLIFFYLLHILPQTV